MTNKSQPNSHKLQRAQLVALCLCILAVFIQRTTLTGTFDFALQKIANARLLGLIKSSIAAVGVLGAIPIGRAADVAGPNRRWISFVAFVALEAISVVVMTGSDGFLPGMVAGQVLLTLSYSSEDLAKAYVADHTPMHSAERTTWMGRYFSCVGLGYFLGPRIARWLKRDFAFTLQGLGCISAGIAVITALIGMVLQSSLMGRHENASTVTKLETPSKEEGSTNPAKKIIPAGNSVAGWKALRSPSLLLLLGVRVLMMLQFHTVTQNMGLTIKRGLGGNAETMDFVVSFFGGTFALLQLTWVPAMAVVCPKPAVALPIAISLTVLGRCFTAAFGSTMTRFLACYFIYMLGQAWHVPVLISQISSHAPKEAISFVMGVTKVLEGLATVSGPVVGGSLVHHFSPFAPLWFGAGSCVAALIPVVVYASQQLSQTSVGGDPAKKQL